VLADIDAVASWTERFARLGRLSGAEREREAAALDVAANEAANAGAVQSAIHFWQGGMRSVFLQDANSLLARTDDLVAILGHLRARFPQIERITTYARSQTAADKGAEDLARLRQAGLDRIHIGMESGADRVLAFMDKGATQEIHIRAGKLVKAAGIELSEYYILGLGGREMRREHALETAEALNRIDPDFIRVRTLSIPRSLPMAEDVREGRFTPQNDVQGAEELLLLLENLRGTGFLVTNDHILNLLPEATGRLPGDLPRMMEAVRWFLELSEYRQMVYRVGRRAGRIHGRADMEDARLVSWAERLIEQEGIDASNIDARLAKIMRGFV
jgi:hypothetical protein